MSGHPLLVTSKTLHDSSEQLVTDLGHLARSLGTTRTGNLVAVAPVRALINVDESIISSEELASKTQVTTEYTVNTLTNSMRAMDVFQNANDCFDTSKVPHLKLRSTTTEKFITKPNFGNFYYAQVIGIRGQEWTVYEINSKSQETPILLLPGLLGTSLQFFKLLNILLPTGIRVVAAQPGVAWSPMEWCEGIVGLIIAMSLRRPHIFAQGLSGYLSLHLLNFKPEFVDSLILNNAFSDTLANEQSSLWLSTVSILPSFVLLNTFYQHVPSESPFPHVAEFVVQEVEDLTQGELASRIVLNCTEEKAPKIHPTRFNHRRITLLETFISDKAYADAAAAVNAGGDYAYPAMQALARTAFADEQDAETYGSRDEPSHGVNMHPGARARLHKLLPGVRIAKLKYGGDFPHLSSPADIALHILLHIQYITEMDKLKENANKIETKEQGPNEDEHKSSDQTASISSPLEDRIYKVISAILPETHGVFVEDTMRSSLEPNPKAQIPFGGVRNVLKSKGAEVFVEDPLGKVNQSVSASASQAHIENSSSSSTVPAQVLVNFVKEEEAIPSQKVSALPCLTTHITSEIEKGESLSKQIADEAQELSPFLIITNTPLAHDDGRKEQEPVVREQVFVSPSNQVNHDTPKPSESIFQKVDEPQTLSLLPFQQAQGSESVVTVLATEKLAEAHEKKSSESPQNIIEEGWVTVIQKEDELILSEDDSCDHIVYTSSQAVESDSDYESNQISVFAQKNEKIGGPISVSADLDNSKSVDPTQQSKFLDDSLDEMMESILQMVPASQNINISQDTANKSIDALLDDLDF